jgi:Bacterial PH domain
MLNGQKIPAKLLRRIDRELEAGEFIKWIEQPLPRFLRLQSLAHFFFGIPWTVFGIVWIYGTATKLKIKGFPEETMQFVGCLLALIGVPLFLIGLWLLTTPLREWLKAFRTVYLITDRRAISIESGWFPTISNYTPAQLRDLYCKERGDGTGDVVITTRLRRDSEGDSWTEEIGFMNVRNPREVERLLQQLAYIKV